MKATTTNYRGATGASGLAPQGTAITINAYVWYGGAQLSRIDYSNSNPVQNSASLYDYGSDGVMHSIKVNDGRPHAVQFTNDVDGQIVRRDESSASPTGNPHEPLR